jgi:hypothetical protein
MSDVYHSHEQFVDHLCRQQRKSFEDLTKKLRLNQATMHDFFAAIVETALNVKQLTDIMFTRLILDIRKEVEPLLPFYKGDQPNVYRYLLQDIMTECFTDYHRGIFYLFSDKLVDQLESMPGQPWNKSPPLPFKSREHFMSLLQEQAKAMIKQYGLTL